jgi:predicted metal-dependent phosphoesterase TrpH
LIITKQFVRAIAPFFVALAIPLWSQVGAPDLVLTGDVTGTQNQTYFEAPFAVPAGTHRISVDFSYTGKEERATLDLGVEDPVRFRGESGGNKSHFTISETDATPSYLPGPIPVGQWRLLIAVPNIRAKSVAHYRAEIRFNSPNEDSSFTAQPLEHGKRWYRGDLHMHTGNSDGSCPSQSGKRVPCPVFLSVETAAARGLDFIAISDHNTDSQNNAMRELQPYFDHVLLIPAREITTFWGHFNIFGVTQFVDFRITPGKLDLNQVLTKVHSKSGIASINHPSSPTGEACMGCGWQPSSSLDMRLFSAVEVINGGQVMQSSTKYWDTELREGHRLAAVGGSDSHNATNPPGPPGSVGWPATAIEADELSVPAILDGIRAGRTFVDLTSSLDKMIDVEAEANGARARMGGTMHLAAGGPIHVQVQAVACAGLIAHLLLDGEETPAVPPIPVSKPDATLGATMMTSAGRHYLRVEVRDSAGVLQLISSPIYVNFAD